ncbi:hypothetical protein, partial [Thalassovita aquimarina]|uniref:hypothetical protein n=1 Tax=Thalassovita aquimarina TaxID=2785917 RepID=UPI0035680FD2
RGKKPFEVFYGFKYRHDLTELVAQASKILDFLRRFFSDPLRIAFFVVCICFLPKRIGYACDRCALDRR